jgi:hypothetical protein
MKLRKLKVATAVGSLTATVALLAGISGAQAQAPGGGSFAGSILIPGSNTSFKVGGYAKWDYVYNFSQQENIVGGFSATSLALDGCQSCGLIGTTVLGIPNSGVATGAGGVVALPASIAAQAGHNMHGGSQMTASESRFNIETRTPTGYGELKTFIEGDFTNPNGLTNSQSFKLGSDSSGFRLRYAYGTLGPWLMGQYNSLFRDSSAEPETLDFGGDPDAGATRQPQVRYTFDYGNGLLFQGAAENPNVAFEGNGVTLAGLQQGTPGAFLVAPIASPYAANTSTFGIGSVDKIPDFTGAVTWNQPWGHIEGRAVLRDVTARDNVPFAAAAGAGSGTNNLSINSGSFGWGMGVSGDYHTWGKDDLTLQVSGGQGAGRYISSGNNPIQDAVVDTFGNLQTIGAMSAQIGYQHWWTDTLRSNLTGGFVYMWQPTCFGCFGVSTTGTSYALAMKDAYTVHANLIWSPVPQVDTGIEYIHGTKRAENGLTGEGDLMQISTKFKF